MRKLVFSLLILGTTCLSVFSQEKLFVIHPVVGDTIDRQEQKEFLLFSDLVSPDFLFATVYHINNRFLIKLHSEKEEKLVGVGRDKVNENIGHIKKLLRYQKRMAKRKERAARKLKLPDLRWGFEPPVCKKNQKRKTVNDPMLHFYSNQDALKTEVQIWNKNYVDEKNCRYTDSPVVNTMIQILINSEI